MFPKWEQTSPRQKGPEMTAVRILKAGLSGAQIQATKDLAIAAGCDAADVSTIDAVGEPEPSGQDEVVLVVLVPPNLEAGALEAELKKVPTGGRRAVCVWPEGGATGAIPDVVGKFCYSIIRWSPDRLRDVLAGDGDNVFEGANGEALPDPNQDHLECE